MAFPPVSAAGMAFAGRHALAVGYRPSAAELVDLDGDGDLDLVIVNTGKFKNDTWVGSTVQIFLDGGGGFGAWTAYTVPPSASDVAICDFDGNGAPDLATTNEAPNTVAILMNDGSGGFAAGALIEVGTDPREIVCADLDGDQLPDIATADAFGLGLSVAFNLGGGSFGASVEYPVGTGHGAYVAAGDVDDDSDVDLLGFVENGVFLLRNPGDGSFGSPELVFSTGRFGPSEFCDFNADGDLDLVSASGVRLGLGGGSFDPDPIPSTFSEDRAAARCFDFDADGQLDVVTREGVALADGVGGLAPLLSFDPPPDPGPVALGDFMGDAKPDLVRTHAGIWFGAIGFGTLIEGRGGAGLAPPPQSYDAGPSVWDVAVDPAGLGVVVANRGPLNGEVGILPSLGDGALGSLSLEPAGVHVRGVALRDLDGDGHRDVVVPNFDPGEVSILRNDSAGGLLPQISEPAGASPEDVAFGDFDAQAGVDIAVVNYLLPDEGTVSILLSDGVGGFAAPLTHGLPCGVSSRIVTADFNEDGATDFAVACGSIDLGLAVGYSKGDGNFSSSMLTTSFGARAVDACDLDQDGWTDLVAFTGDASDFDRGAISTFLNTGTGGFAVGAVRLIPYWDYRIRCEDVSGDGIPDVALPYREGSVVGVFEGVGNGSFADPIYYEVGAETRSVAIGDLDGDDRPDLIVANGEINRVTVLLNTSDSASTPVPALSTPALRALAALLLGLGLSRGHRAA